MPVCIPLPYAPVFIYFPVLAVGGEVRAALLYAPVFVLADECAAFAYAPVFVLLDECAAFAYAPVLVFA